MPSRICYNAHTGGIHDAGKFIDHLKALNPHAVLIMDGLQLAARIKRELTDCIVIHRNWAITKGDDDVHTRVSPEMWMALRAREADYGLHLHTTCEPGFNNAVIDWHIGLMERAAARKIPLVIGNFSVGTPQPDQWGQARGMLELLDAHRDLFLLGLHEYACGVITSGLVGGPPTEIKDAAGNVIHPNFIPIKNWPANARNLTKFHCGRFQFLVNYCESIRLKPPRIVLTEHGFDALSDLTPWTRTLKPRAPYTEIRGWKTLADEWRGWWPQWDDQRALFEQLVWADKAIYQNSPVEAQLLFTHSYVDAKWDQFDVQQATELQTYLEAYASLDLKPAEPPPVIIAPAIPLEPSPTPTPTIAQVRNQLVVKLREMADLLEQLNKLEGAI